MCRAGRGAGAGCVSAVVGRGRGSAGRCARCGLRAVASPEPPCRGGGSGARAALRRVGCPGRPVVACGRPASRARRAGPRGAPTCGGCPLVVWWAGLRGAPSCGSCRSVVRWAGAWRCGVARSAVAVARRGGDPGRAGALRGGSGGGCPLVVWWAGLRGALSCGGCPSVVWWAAAWRCGVARSAVAVARRGGDPGRAGALRGGSGGGCPPAVWWAGLRGALSRGGCPPRGRLGRGHGLRTGSGRRPLTWAGAVSRADRAAPAPRSADTTAHPRAALSRGHRPPGRAVSRPDRAASAPRPSGPRPP